MNLATRITTLSFAIPFCLGTLAMPAHSQITKSGSGYLLRVKYTKGATTSYNMGTTVSMPGAKQPQTVNIPMSMKVVSVVKGVATVLYKVGPMPGQQKASEATVKVDSRGNVIGDGGPAISGVTGMSLPAKPVKVGESWTTKGKMGGMAGAMDATTKYSFKGLKTVSGKQMASFDVSMTGSTKEMKFGGNGTMLVLVADGSLHKMNMDQVITMGGNPIKTKVSIVRK